MLRTFGTHTLFVAAACLGPALYAQSKPPTMYDVSTVKPSTKTDNSWGVNWNHGQLKADNITLSWILTAAFDIREDQLTGQPNWAKEQHYDINAKLLDADPAVVEKMSPEQDQVLLLALLVERFGLKYHVEVKEMATYDLLPAKAGLKLNPAAYSGDKSKQVYDTCSRCFSWGDNYVTAHDVPFTSLTRVLANQLKRTVNDRTGYTGNIDIKMKWAPELGTGTVADEDAGLPPLPRALEEQLGLHLQPSRGPVKLYVVDHLDKPSDN